MQAAIKFYLDRKGFESERELYTESELKAMMPATLAVEDNASGDCKTPYGYVFPPFVIIERGESLDEWSRDNANKDIVTIFQVRALAPMARSWCLCKLSTFRVCSMFETLMSVDSWRSWLHTTLFTYTRLVHAPDI